MRKGWIDYARGIAIILVVYKHVLLGFVPAGVTVHSYIYNLQEFFYNLRMPLFFIVSGLFITNSIQRRTKLQFFQYKFDTIFYPYLVWAILYLTLKIAAGAYINFSMDPSAYFDVLIRPRTIDHFWYLYTLFVIIMLNAIFQWTFGLNRIMLLILGLIAYAFSFMVHEDYMALNDVLFYFLFMVVGVLCSDFILSEKNREVLSSFKLFFILLPFFLASQLYWLLELSGIVRLTELTGWSRLWNIPMIILGCLFILNVASILDKFNAIGVIKRIGKHSLYIYIMHLMAIGAVRVVLVKTPLKDYADLFFVVVFAAGIALPIFVYKLTMKLGMWYLYLPRRIDKKVE